MPVVPGRDADLALRDHAALPRRDHRVRAEADPADPPGFRSQQWRFPVRFETAIEYLGINPEEASKLFGAPLSANDVLALYGLAPGSSLDDVLGVAEFLTATGLTYCQLVELINTGREGIEVFPVDGESPIDPPPCSPAASMTSCSASPARTSRDR